MINIVREVLKFNHFFSNSTSSSLTSGWFSPFIVLSLDPYVNPPEVPMDSNLCDDYHGVHFLAFSNQSTLLVLYSMSHHNCGGNDVTRWD